MDKDDNGRYYSDPCYGPKYLLRELLLPVYGRKVASPLCPYARATACPVLTFRLLLRPGRRISAQSPPRVDEASRREVSGPLPPYPLPRHHTNNVATGRDQALWRSYRQRQKTQQSTDHEMVVLTKVSKPLSTSVRPTQVRYLPMRVLGNSAICLRAPHDGRAR
eukprot:3726364-Rhodomonas_salina.2